MKILRLAALTSIVGGAVTFVRLTQALAIEISYAGSHDLGHTVPLFLAVALASIALIWYGALFLKAPKRSNASSVSRTCAFSLWILLVNLDVTPAFSVLAGCLAYFALLKPAVISQFGTENCRISPQS